MQKQAVKEKKDNLLLPDSSYNLKTLLKLWYIAALIIRYIRTMHYNRSFYYILVTLVLLLSSCGKDTEMTVPEPNTIGRTNENVTLVIKVSDEDNDPIAGVDVLDVSNTRTYCTNQYGLVYISNVTVPSTGLQIKTSHPDYVESFHLVQAEEHSQLSLFIQLSEDVDPPLVSTDRVISKVNEYIVTLPDSLLNIEGQKTGDPIKLAFHKNDRDALFSSHYPPNLAKTQLNELTLFEIDAWYTLEFTDVQDQPIFIPRDSFYILQIPNPNDIDSIAYYTLDSDDYLWEKRGYLRKQGIYLTDSIESYFSFATGREREISPFTFKLLDIDGDSIRNQSIKVFSDEGDLLNVISSDQYGNAFTYVVKEESFQIETNNINKEVLSFSIEDGTNRVDVMLEEKYYEAATQALKCGDNIDSTAVAHIVQNGQEYLFHTEGDNINMSLPSSENMSLQLHDITDANASEVVTADINSPLGPYELCDDVRVGETVVISQNISQDVTFRSCDVYILSSMIYVEPGVTLTIEPGTIIKSEMEAGLVISNGATIDANGNTRQPILFTSIQDDVQPGNITGSSLDITDSGLWKGLYLLGDAPTSADGTIASLSDPNLNTYGGEDDTYDTGTLRYVSIRHGGNGTAALTLAGISGTSAIDHIEVFSSGAGGIDIIGGSCEISEVIVAETEASAIKISGSYSGTLTNSILLLSSENDYPLEYFGDESETVLDSSIIQNVTIRGVENTNNGKGNYMALGTNAKTAISRVYFFDFADHATFQLVDGSTSANYGDTTLTLTALEFNVSHLTSGNTSIEQLFVDQSGQDIFMDHPPSATLVTSNTVGANKNVFLSWSYADLLNLLEDF